MRVSESILIIYFTYLSVAAGVRRVPASRIVRVIFAGVVAATAVTLVRLAPATPAMIAARDWLPAPLLLLAYFVTGACWIRPWTEAEAWLRAWDRRLVGDLQPDRIPRVIRTLLELLYTSCFVLIPAGLSVLVVGGRSDLADHYWALVLAAELGAFGMLPWIQTRPPWALEAPRASDAVGFRRFSLLWVRRTSICVNTFPSGHAAGSLAVALGVLPAAPVSAAVLAAMALTIAVASVVGRYHYVLDAITGVVLALVVWAAVSAAGV